METFVVEVNRTVTAYVEIPAVSKEEAYSFAKQIVDGLAPTDFVHTGVEDEIVVQED